MGPKALSSIDQAILVDVLAIFCYLYIYAWAIFMYFYSRGLVIFVA